MTHRKESTYHVISEEHLVEEVYVMHASQCFQLELVKDKSRGTDRCEPDLSEHGKGPITAHQNLRAMASNLLMAWRVPFFQET